MPAFVAWISRVISLLWKPFFAVITGFFVWLARILKDFFTRNIKDLSWRRTVFNGAAFTLPVSIYITSVVGAFIGLVGVLLNIYSSIRSALAHLSAISGGGGSAGGGVDALALFNALANSIGLYKALSDTFTLWAPFYVLVFSCVGAYIYYKVTLKSFQKAKEFMFYGKSSK